MKKTFYSLTILLFMCFFFQLPPLSASAEELEQMYPDGDYLIINQQGSEENLYYLGFSGSTPKAGTELKAFGPVSKLPGHLSIWHLTWRSGFSYIQPRVDLSLYLEQSQKTSDGWKLQLSKKRNAKTQQWALISFFDRLVIAAINDGQGYLLAYRNASTGMSAPAFLADLSTENINAVWQLIPYEPAQPIRKGQYVLTSELDDSLVLSAKDTSNFAQDFTNVQTATRQNNDMGYVFDVIPLDNGYYKLVHHLSGKCLDVSAASRQSGANVQLYADNGTDAQQWAILPHPQKDGYILVARCSGCALDIQNADRQPGNNVQQYYYNLTNAQIWSFQKASDRTAKSYEAQTSKRTSSSSTPTPRPNSSYSFTTPLVYPVQKNSISYHENFYHDPYYVKGMPQPSTVQYGGSSIRLSDASPEATNGIAGVMGIAPYEFIGWSTNPRATYAEYQPGEWYYGEGHVNLYAVWRYDESRKPGQGLYW